MTALIKYGRRSCNSRCYEAKSEKGCRCVCAGLNHHVGRIKAEKNTSEHAEELIFDGAHVRIPLPGM